MYLLLVQMDEIISFIKRVVFASSLSAQADHARRLNDSCHGQLNSNLAASLRPTL